MGIPDPSPFEPLTRRERDVLALLAEGLTAPEIAQRLTLGLSSVKSHMQHLYRKLGANSKRQAVSRARELGLLAPATTFPAVALPSQAGTPRAKHNLPAQITSFIGREEEVVQITRRLARHRLVTLTGSGGVGKTRLSLRVAEEAREDYSDGVWLVELAALSDPSLVLPQVAAALGLHVKTGRRVFDDLIVYLRDREVLLVVDNCEHLLDSVARLVEDLLRVRRQRQMCIRDSVWRGDLSRAPFVISWLTPIVSARGHSGLCVSASICRPGRPRNAGLPGGRT